MARQTWFRGEAIGATPAKSGTKNRYDLGSGLYLTDKLDVAYRYSTQGTRNNPDALPSVRYVEFDLAAQGKVLDLTSGPYANKWEAFRQEPVSPSGGGLTKGRMMEMNEGYRPMFEAFLKQNSINISDYDIVKAPDYTNGTNQLCILDKGGGRSALADKIDTMMTVGKPMSASGPSEPVTPAQAEAAILAGFMIANYLLNALSDYFQEKWAREDLIQWANHIDEQRAKDPTLGYLVVVVFSQVKPLPDSIMQPNPKYEYVQVFTAPTRFKAEQMLRADPAGNLLPKPPPESPMPIQYSSRKFWIAPVRSEESGKDWKGRLQAVKNAMAPPPDYTEAFQILDGSSMADMLQILDKLRQDASQVDLPSRVRYANGVNQDRLFVGLIAVDHRSHGLSYDKLKIRVGNWMNAVESEGQKALQAFFGQGSGSTDPTAFLMVGTWDVRIGNWSGSFIFRDDKTVSWADGKPGRHPGKWWFYEGAVNWQFDDDPPGFKRTFEAAFPVQTTVRGRILPEGQGFFEMTKVR